MDKYKALWLSHSKIADFLSCPRLFYLRHIYKNPKTGHKFTLMTPSLALGQAVHTVVESLSTIPTEERLNAPLLEKFDLAWEEVKGKKGGFKSKVEEAQYKERGRAMLSKILKNPGPIKNKALKIKPADGDLAYYWFSEDDGIILSGKIDWIEYLPKTDSVHIIDFKTGKNEEDSESLQLPIYYLLAKNLQKRKVSKLSYWYLDRGNSPVEMKLPSEDEAIEKVNKIAQRINLARKIERFKCETGGCWACRDMEQVFEGKGEKVGETRYHQDIYVL